MSIICPNFSNPDVARDFNELVEATSEKAAYAIWSLNNGNAIDKAPNGALSKLFNDLLKHFKGDRKIAIRVKASLFGKPFMDWFGDWVGANSVYDDNGIRVDEVSKVVDYNGEPLMVYHGSDNYGFREFDPLKADDKISLFSSSSRYIASTYTKHTELNNKVLRLSLIDNNAIELIKNKLFDKVVDIIKNTINRHHSIRYDEESWMLHGVLLIYEQLNLSNLTQDDVYALYDLLSKIEDAPYYTYDAKIKHHPEITWRNKPEYDSIRIHDYDRGDNERFRDTSIVFEGDVNDLIDSIMFDTKVYGLFENIKNPLVLDNQRGEYGGAFNWNEIYFQGKQWKTRDIAKYAKDNGYDGVIFEQIVDHGPNEHITSPDYPVTDRDIAYEYFHEGEDSYTGLNVYMSNIYISFKPNQLKAVTNDGSYSDANDMYQNVTIFSIKDHLNRLLNHPTEKYNVKGMIDEVNKDFGRQMLHLYHDDDTDTFAVSIDAHVDPSLKDYIEKTNQIDIARIRKICEFLQSKFTNSLTYEEFTEDQWRANNLPQQSNSFIKGNKIYIRISKVTSEIAAEEFLHTLVFNLKHDNPQLFNNLLSYAKNNFKKLYAEIKLGYKKNQNRDEELVTQTLARYFNNKFDSAVDSKELNETSAKNTLSDLVSKFKNWLFNLFKSVPILNLYLLKFEITADNINPIVDFDMLADMLLTNDTIFVTSPIQGVRNNSIANQSITRQMYDIGVDINTERLLYIRSIVDQYKQSNPNADQVSLSRVMNNARKSFDTDKSNQIMQLKQLILAQSFGLSMNQKGFFESSETTQKKLMLEHFINSLQEATFKAYSLENINRGKYELVGAVLNAGSVANVLYNAIYNGDLTTLDKELARDYVRMFWTSPLIQSALDVLNTSNKTAKQVEDDLVEHMTKDPVSERSNAIIDWFRNIWQQLNQLVHTVFGAHVFTDQQKEDILKAVDAAFMVAEDMELAQEGSKILDREDGDFSTSDLLSDKDKSILSDIYNGTKTRLRSQQARTAQDPKLISDLKSRLEIIDGKNLDSIEDTFNIIEDFLLFANKEIGQTLYMIDSKFLISGDMNTWDPQEINFIQQDLIGHYSSLLNSIYLLFSDKSSAINKYNEHRVNTDPNKVDLKNVASQLIESINSIKLVYNQDIVKPYVRKVLTDYVNEQDAITDKKTFIYNMERWLEQDSTYGDLAAGEVLIGMASRSKSPIVRIVEKMASEAEFETNREVLKKGNELVRLYNKIRPTGSQISPYNWQKKFMELDRNGVSTGYFIRELNEGQFFKDKDEYEAKLRSEFNLTADEDGHTIFPEEEFTKDDSKYNKYNDKLDEWLDERCNRRYKLEYYKARRRHLSPKTIQAQNRIQRQIDLILDKCRMESGLVDLSKLTLNERHQLEQYRREKRDLGSHYIFTYGSDGILRVEEKVGDALKMADEISEWNKYITDKVKYKPDWTAFNKAISDMQAAGATQEEIDLFKRNNTVMRLTPEFYDLLHKVVGKAATSPKLELLKHRHKEILNALKERQGAVAHNLSKLGSGLNTDLSGWKELHRLEQEMADEKRRLKAAGIKGQPGEIESMGFSEVATMLYVPISDTDQSAFLPTLIELWRSAAVSNTNLHNIFNELFMYRDEKGKMRYLNAFKYLTPLKYTLTVNNETIDCIQSLPGSEYSELDESSPFVNENFKKNGKSMQVKDMYKNEDYAKLTDDEKTFLNALLGAMDEANSRIPNKSLNRDGRLPQISGRTMAVIANTMMAKEWSTALKYPFRKFGVKYSETDTDVTTNMDLARRPDGSVVNNIPIRFVEKLPDSSVQSTDVLGSVIMYYDMACNYANKSKNLPTLELIKYAIDPSQAENGNKMDDQYAKVENILDQRYYGKETSFGFNSEEKITPAKLRTIQGTKTIRNLAAVAMLGVNFTTIEVGYIDALCSMMADAVGGKYLTGVDMRKAFAQCIAHTGKMLKGLGNPVVHDKLVAAMLYNQLSRSNSEIFSSTDKFKFDRFVHDHLLMGGYTLADYMINSMMLTATYNHYRLIRDPKTGKDKFFSKTDAINTFTSLGYTEKEAIKQWKASKITLWDAYEEKDGLFVKKAEYENIITKKLEDQIAGRLRDRTAMYNGVVPMTEKAKMQLNVFGSFVTLMRNFYVNTYWDKFKTGGDYVVEDGDHHIGWTSEYKRDDLGLVNLETGEFEGAVFKDFCRGMYKLAANYKAAFRSGLMDTLTESQSYAVKRCLTEIGTITALAFLMLWSVAFARSNDYDDDKDPVWLLNIAGVMPWREEKFLTFDFDNADKKFFDFLRWKLALLSTRGFTERLTSWWPPTVLELFTSPSTAKSYLDDVCTIWDLSLDMFSQHADDEIKTGGYKHMTRRTRDVLKLGSAFGVDNLVRLWHTDGIKTTFNYYRKLTPTSAIVPSQSEWNEEQGLGKHGGKKSENKSSKKRKSNGFAY